MTFKSKYSEINVTDENIRESEYTTNWKEILLHENQLDPVGMAPAIEVGFSANVSDGDTFILKNTGLTETFTFKLVPMVAFDVQIGGAFTNTRDNLVTQINTDSADWGAVVVPGSASGLIVYRTAFDGTNDDDRVYGVLGTQTDMVYLALNDGLYEIDFIADAVTLLAADPAVKEFGVGRPASEFIEGEAHAMLYGSVTRKWNPLSDTWDDTITGIEAFFLDARGAFGSGGGWADSGFISNLPTLLFAQNLTERAIYMFYALSRTLYDSIDPVVAFIVYSTTAPSLGDEDVRWQLEARYIAEDEGPGKAADETLLITQSLDNFIANERQAILEFTLDRTLITDQDVLMFTLERIGGDGADTYDFDVAVGQAGIILETLPHNP